MSLSCTAACMCAAQIKAGLRVAVQPHGGHFWSSMGQVQRPMDIVSLRIDNQVLHFPPADTLFTFPVQSYPSPASFARGQCAVCPTARKILPSLALLCKL